MEGFNLSFMEILWRNKKDFYGEIEYMGNVGAITVSPSWESLELPLFSFGILFWNKGRICWVLERNLVFFTLLYRQYFYIWTQYVICVNMYDMHELCGKWCKYITFWLCCWDFGIHINDCKLFPRYQCCR